MSETVKDSEIKQKILRGEKTQDYAAVIRPKKAQRLVVRSLGAFEKDNPTHTNDPKLIAASKENGNLIVTGDVPESKAKAKSDDKADAKSGKPGK